MRPIQTLLALAAAMLAASGAAHGEPFPLSVQRQLPLVVHDNQATMRLAADMLGHDLAAVSGLAASASTRLEDCTSRCIVIGTIDSALVQDTARSGGIDLAPLRGQWERYLRVALHPKDHPERSVLLIAGSDKRGAVYGAVELGRELGVSAWEWWADVTPQPRTELSVDGGLRLSSAPSVQYRGIFLNDEDWGLQPWAAKTFDPARDIGPTSYARIYELLWRLKANLIWPAMHPSTRAFYSIPGNPQMADDYAIVVGSSHSEAMLRNNVGEWNAKTAGAYNFFTNREAMLRYWQQRADESKGYESIYTVGLRGAHDSAMEGVGSVEQGRDTLAEVFGIQRRMLSQAKGKPADQVPQVFTAYKEVLGYYNAGLEVPDDVTLIWPDDNYGYLHQLSTADERKRTGGSGIYYHISYWGRPHDYLWLATTHPALIRDQLQRAWAMEARRLWVVNVGDIKPGEYLTQYFLDLAFDASKLQRAPREHLAGWAAAQFGPAHARVVTDIMMEYYALAWERRPEFMGFGQTEPTTPNRRTDYLRSGGEEAELRLARYRSLAARAQALSQQLPASLRDAYFELVLYPVRSAANLNTRVLKLDLANEYARQRRPSANLYAQQARAAHAALVLDTAAYNALGNGKWRHMMDLAPRRLPVFEEPVYPSWSNAERRGCAIVYPAPHSTLGDRLAFTRGQASTAYLTLVSYGEQPVAWSVREGARGVHIDNAGGELAAANGYEQRIAVQYDGSAKPALSIQCGNQVVNASLRVEGQAIDGVAGERERIIVMPAAAAASSAEWEDVPGLGSAGAGRRARLDLAPRKADALANVQPQEYHFANATDSGAQVRLVAVPVHPLTSSDHVRIGVSLDGGAVEVFDYQTFERSDEWKRNVLSNMAVRSMTLSRLKPGLHTLRVYAIDPGVVLDRIDVVMDGAPQYYGMPPGG
jgi:hypothetical protein